MLQPNRKRRYGFTLVETMTGVLIISALLAIAVPNFARARESSWAKSCQSNLKQIEGAREQWLLENRASASPAMTDLAPAYIRSTPVCPSGGTYALAAGSGTPTCSIGGTEGDYSAHVLDGSGDSAGDSGGEDDPSDGDGGGTGEAGDGDSGGNGGGNGRGRGRGRGNGRNR